jgi:hypothetical protein
MTGLKGLGLESFELHLMSLAIKVPKRHAGCCIVMPQIWEKIWNKLLG